MKDRVDTLARLLFEKLPEDVRRARDDLRQNFADVLGARLGAWGLATREELEEASAQLHRCRQRLDQLEQRIRELEK